MGLLPRVVFFTLDGKRVVEDFLQFQYVFLVVQFHIMLANYSAINPETYGIRLYVVFRSIGVVSGAFCVG